MQLYFSIEYFIIGTCDWKIEWELDSAKYV